MAPRSRGIQHPRKQGVKHPHKGHALTAATRAKLSKAEAGHHHPRKKHP